MPSTRAARKAGNPAHAEGPRDLAGGDHQDDDPEDDVDEVPDPDLADADEHLAVVGLREHVVERPLPDVVDQALHVRLDERPDDPADQREHAHDREQLGVGPAVEVLDLVEDEREHDEPGRERDQRLHQLDRQVGAVLELVEGAHTGERPEQPERAHQPPTAEYRWIAILNVRCARLAPMMIHSPCMTRPPRSTAGGRSPDQGLDREREGVLEGQDRGQLARPVGQQLRRHEAPREQQLGGEVEAEDRPDPGRPERDHAEADWLSERIR